jgi:hypothetical protein
VDCFSLRASDFEYEVQSFTLMFYPNKPGALYEGNGSGKKLRYGTESAAA